MKTAKLDSMVKGWFVGNFEPTLYSTKSDEQNKQKEQPANTVNGN